MPQIKGPHRDQAGRGDGDDPQPDERPHDFGVAMSDAGDGTKDPQRRPATRHLSEPGPLGAKPKLDFIVTLTISTYDLCATSPGGGECRLAG